ncbi:MAG: hypothetical protein ACJ72W_24830 [Actinoallomurus sp.]
MDWPVALAAGGGGGLIVEAVVLLQNLETWRDARRRTRSSTETAPTHFSDHVDVVPDALAALTRMVIGAAMGLLLHTQITGTWAAVAIGASAPALVRQLGAMQSVREAVGAGADAAGDRVGTGS